MLTYLPESLKEPEFRSFLVADSEKQKITRGKTALVAETDKLCHRQKLKKILELKKKYESELVMLEASQTSLLFFNKFLLMPDNQSNSQQP